MLARRTSFNPRPTPSARPFNSEGAAPPRRPLRAPHPHRIHRGPCDICSGPSQPSSRCHGSRRSEPAHWLRARRKKRPAVSGSRVLRPPCRCGQLRPATVTRRGAAGARGDRPPQLCAPGPADGPRSMSLASPSSAKRVKDKAERARQSGLPSPSP